DLLSRSKGVRLVTVEAETESDALRWLRRHGERPYSFVDATSFMVMKSMRIRQALAFDEDFNGRLPATARIAPQRRRLGFSEPRKVPGMASKSA
ncbi:MAG: hypothetical protein ACRDIU_08560, partial [Actinomycetota bacterium]